MKKKLLSFLILCLSFGCQNVQTSPINARKLFQENKLIFMEVNPRTFGAKDYNNNEIIDFELGETSGSFISATDRLDELKKMGINAIHIMPVTPVGKFRALGTAGSLYAISDFTKISDEFDVKGNGISVFNEFKAFVKEAHKKNIAVIVDIPSCGSYDLYLQKPELFYKTNKNEPISPADWLDVYLFKTKNSDGTINNEVFNLYKKFIDLLLSADADGIRADVATIKPYDFWEDLISYTRDRNPNFLFFAEASNSWTTPPCKQCEFTPFNKLFSAGFDGYYGSYFNYKDWKSGKDLIKQVKFDRNLSKKYLDKKSVIGSFTTHDEQSPILIGGYNYAVQIIWLNMLLPLNPYFVDGIQSGDNYIYAYANQKAKSTTTDNLYYYVHKGKIDIFNYSKQPSGIYPQLKKEIELATKFRKYAQDVVLQGNIKNIRTNNPNVFSFKRTFDGKTILVVINKDKNQKQNATVKYKNIFSKSNYSIIKTQNNHEFMKNKIYFNLDPSEIVVLYSEK